MAKWLLRLQIVCADLVPLILSVSILSRLSLHEQKLKMQQMGLQARFMSQALRKMSGNASKAGCTLIFLNQIRYKIGVYYGNPEVTSGGIALKFFASVRLEIRSTGKIKYVKGDEEIGVRVRERVQKSKNIDKIHLVNCPVLVIHATVGPCNTPESNAWNAVEKRKWSSNKECGYFIMCYMRDIIEDKDMSLFPSKWERRGSS